MTELKFDLQTFSNFTGFPQQNNEKYRKFTIAELEHYSDHYEPLVFLLLASSMEEGMEFFNTAIIPESLDQSKSLLKLAYNENGMPSALYGPTICRNKDQLVLSYGDFEFAVGNDKKDLVVGGLRGNFEIEKNQDGTKRYLKARFFDAESSTGYEFIISCLMEDRDNPPSISELNGKLNKNESIVELFKPLMPPITLMDELPNGDYIVKRIGEPKMGQYGLNVVISCEGISTFLQKGHASHMRATKGFDLSTKQGDYQTINKQIEDGKEWILRIVDGGVKKAGINKGQPKKNSQLFPAELSFSAPQKTAPLMLNASVETVAFTEVVTTEKELATAGKKTKTKPQSSSLLDEDPF